MKVAVVSGYGIHDFIVNHHPEVQLDLVPDINAGLKKVSLGMVDAMVANIAMATFYIEKHGITNLRIAGESGYVYRWAFASRRDWPVLNHILDKGLAKITPEERKKIHNSWIHLGKSNWEELKKIFGAILIASIVLSLGTALIYYTLKKQVKRRTRELNDELIKRKSAEEALRESERQTKELFEKLQSVVRGTSETVGEDFFHSLVHHLQLVLNVKFAFLGEIESGNDDMVRTLASAGFGDLPTGFAYSVKGTPCDLVTQGNNAWFPENVQKQFPEDEFLVHHNIESYLGVPLVDLQGKVIGHLVVMDDKPMEEVETHKVIINLFASRVLAEIVRRNTDRELIAAKEMAEQASQAKTRFLSQMSHELRTPMNAILGFTQLMLLRNEKNGVGENENLEEIIRAGNHLMELIDEVLDLSHVESGKMKIKHEKLEINSLILKAVNLSAPLLEGKNIQMVNHVQEDETLCIYGDPLRIQQVLINLIANAIKYNKAGGLVQLELDYDPDRVCRIRVRDTGIGIDPEKLNDLFEPFERLGAEETSIEGTGIGLTLSHRLMQMMNGRIEVESTPGEGSCFTLVFPVSETLPKVHSN